MIDELTHMPVDTREYVPPPARWIDATPPGFPVVCRIDYGRGIIELRLWKKRARVDLTQWRDEWEQKHKIAS